MNKAIYTFDIQYTLDEKLSELIQRGYSEPDARAIITDALQSWEVQHTPRAYCRCCQREITIEYQPRRVKPPLFLLTCRTERCQLNDVTFTLEELEDYYTRDISDKYTINR